MAAGSDNLTDPLANILGPLDGARLPAECSHCGNAYHTVVLTARSWTIRLFHDSSCPLFVDHAAEKPR